MQVAIYTRVSTKHQVEEGYSLEAQRNRLIKICELNNDTVYKVYSDEGKSGKDTNRPELQKLLLDAKKHAFDKVLVMKLDRISRSITDLEKIVNILKENNIEFESASEKLDTSSSMGMMFIRLLGVFAQFERERIQERINDTFAEMIDKGQAITGSQPFGYCLDKDKKPIKDINTQDIVNDFYIEFDKTHSLYKTIIYIQDKHNIKRGQKEWKKLLTETYYYGAYKTNDNYYPKYIEKEKWIMLNEIFEKRNIKKTPSKKTYLFTGLLICSNCNHTLKSGSTSKVKYYRCTDGTYKKCSSGCKTISESIIEDYLINNLENKIKEFESNYEITYTEEKIKSNKAKIKALEEELERLDYMYLKNRIKQEMYDKEYLRIQKNITKAKTNAPREYNKITLPSNWKDTYYQLNDDNKQKFWHAIIECIYIDLNKQKRDRITSIVFNNQKLF